MDEQLGTNHAIGSNRSWPPPAAARPETAAAAPASEARIADIVGKIEGMVRDVVRQANDEAGRLMDSARRERDSMLRTAERDAATTTTQARRQGDAIVEAARGEAASVAEQSERLSREFVTQVQTLLAARRAAASTDEPAEHSAGVNLASGLSLGGKPALNSASGNGLRIEPDLVPPPSIAMEDTSRVFLPEAVTREPDHGNADADGAESQADREPDADPDSAATG